MAVHLLGKCQKMNKITKSLIKERGGRPCDSSLAFKEINYKYFIERKAFGQTLWQPSANEAKKPVYYHKTECPSSSACTCTCLWDAHHQFTKTSLNLVVVSMTEVQEKLFCGLQQLGSLCGPWQPQQHFCFKHVVFFLKLLPCLYQNIYSTRWKL